MRALGMSTRVLVLFWLHAQLTFAQAPSFEVATIKLNKSAARSATIQMPAGRFIARNMGVKFLVQFAYEVKDFQISGMPDWVNTQNYDIDAKIDDATFAQMQKLNVEQQQPLVRALLQALLVDRFKLAVGHETKQLPVYALLVAKNGVKLQPTSLSPEDSTPPKENEPPRRLRGPTYNINRGEMTTSGVNMDLFADMLSRQLSRIVLNKTELTAKYDFKLKWAPDDGANQVLRSAGEDAPPPADTSGPTLFTALQEQLGLKLEPQKGPVEMLVINRIEKPTEN